MKKKISHFNAHFHVTDQIKCCHYIPFYIIHNKTKTVDGGGTLKKKETHGKLVNS